VYTNRPAFFNDVVAPRVKDNTIMSIDANCVPDTTLDLLRQGTSEWKNHGALELHNITTAHDLSDIVREKLGQSPLFTNHTNTSQGITKTRIDQIYTPQLDGITFDPIISAPDFLKNKTTFGHTMQQIRVTTIQQERGRDLRSISEAIFDDPTFNAELARLIEVQSRGTKPGEWGQKWEAIKQTVRERCLEKTTQRRQQRNDELDELRTKLKHLEANISGGTADASMYVERGELEKEIKKQQQRNRSLHDMLEKEAIEKGAKHDVNTAAFHRRWTPKNSAQWVAELKLADWTDPSNPRPAAGPASTNEHSAIANAFKNYYGPLYADKPIEPDAKEKALATLRRGNRVLPPTARKCGAAITDEEVLHT
jgi:hypothetical protein